MAKKKKDEEPEGASIEGIEPLLQQLRAIKDEKEQIALRVKKLNEEEAYLEPLIISKMRSEGISLLRAAPYGTASIGEQIYPSVRDFDKLWLWIFKNKRFELLPHSIKTAAWREAVAAGEVIPEVDSYKEDTLNFRRTPKSAE